MEFTLKRSFPVEPIVAPDCLVEHDLFGKPAATFPDQAPSLARSRTDLNSPHLVAVAFNPDLAMSPVATGRQLRVGRRRVSAGRRRSIRAGRGRPVIRIRRRRIVTGRRGRIIITGRRSVGDCAANNCAGEKAAEQIVKELKLPTVTNRPTSDVVHTIQ